MVEGFKEDHAKRREKLTLIYRFICRTPLNGVCIVVSITAGGGNLKWRQMDAKWEREKGGQLNCTFLRERLLKCDCGKVEHG